jgi:hypothetical protein
MKEKSMAHPMKVMILIVVFGMSLPTMTGAVICDNVFSCNNAKVVTNKTDKMMKVNIHYYHGSREGYDNNQAPGWKDILIALHPEQTYRFSTYTSYSDPFITFTVYNKNNEELCKTQLEGIKQFFYLKKKGSSFCMHDN